MRAALAGAGAAVLLGLAAAPAAADVAVTPGEAAQGDAANLTFRITNDSRTASVTAIEVSLPADTPIAEVYPMSVPDWAPSMTNVKVDKPVESLHGYQLTDVTTAVKWIAMPDRALAPGATTELYLAIGPLPAVAQLSFQVVLSNSDGTQTRGTDPVLVLKAGAAGQGGDHAAAHGGAAPATTAAPAPGSGGGNPAPGGISYLGWSLLARLFILGISVAGLVLDRRRAPAPEPKPQTPAEDDEMATANS
jgi:hypothetical protein